MGQMAHATPFVPYRGAVMNQPAAQAEQGCVSPLTFGCVGPLNARHLSQTGTGAGVGWP